MLYNNRNIETKHIRYFMEKKTLIIAIGSGAQKCINNLQDDVDFSILCVENDKNTLNKTTQKTLFFDNFNEKFLWQELIENNTKPHKRLNKEQISLIRNELINFKDVILISTLGGSFSSYITSAFIEILILMNINFKIITTIPFELEGKRRAFASKQALDELKALSCIKDKNLFIYECDEILYGNKNIKNISDLFEYRDSINQLKSIEDGYKAIDMQIIEILMRIAK